MLSLMQQLIVKKDKYQALKRLYYWHTQQGTDLRHVEFQLHKVKKLQDVNFVSLMQLETLT